MIGGYLSERGATDYRTTAASTIALAGNRKSFPPRSGRRIRSAILALKTDDLPRDFAAFEEVEGGVHFIQRDDG